MTNSHQVKEEILALRNEGSSYRAIARQVGVSHSYVQQVCNGSIPMATRNPQEYLDQALTEREDYGECAMAIRYELKKQYPGEKIPAESTIHTHLKAHNRVSHALHRTNKYRPWWMEDRPNQPGEMFQIDTLKLKPLNGKAFEVFTVYDVVSRAGWVEIVPSQSSYVWALSRAFQALGVPKAIQCDNGFGFVCGERYQLCHLAQYAFEL
jgi:transcriptional regulator with XRE-family HTH domain